MEYADTTEAITKLAEFADDCRKNYKSTEDWTLDDNGGSCTTIRVPVALLNRIRDARKLLP